MNLMLKKLGVRCLWDAELRCLVIDVYVWKQESRTQREKRPSAVVNWCRCNNWHSLQVNIQERKEAERIQCMN